MSKSDEMTAADWAQLEADFELVADLMEGKAKNNPTLSRFERPDGTVWRPERKERENENEDRS